MKPYEYAIHYARRSSIMRHRTGAVIFNGGDEPISTGWSHRTHLRLQQTPYSMHAELHALLRARHLDLRGATIYVATLNASETKLVSGKPCIHCTLTMLASGIVSVGYSTYRDWHYINLVQLAKELRADACN